MDNRPNTGSMLPVHNTLQMVSTGSTHTAYNFYNNSLSSFTTLASASTGSLHSTFKPSGYAYINTAISTLVKIFDESMASTDSLINLGVFLEDKIEAYDFLQVIETKIKEFEDTLDVNDQITVVSLLGETTPVSDSLQTFIVKSFSDTLPIADTVLPVVPFISTSSVVVQSTPVTQIPGSTKISVDGYINNLAGLNIVNTSSNLASVTNASSVQNAFLPTIISEGVTYVENACTAPPPGYVVGPDTYWINYLPNGIGGTSNCDISRSNMSLSYSGGQFSVVSQNPLGVSGFYQGNLGRTIDIYGLLGTITDFGEILNSSENFYITEGIFGSPNLNKPFNLVTFGSSQYFSFINNQNSLQYAPKIDRYTTIKGMAEAIASLCGIAITWLIPDAPYSDIFNQSGLTGYDALSTLASQMGGTLRWNGTNNYIVCYPDFVSSAFDIPTSKLLAAGGISYQWHQDMTYGVSGAGVLGVPTNVFFDSGIKTLPNGTQVTPQEDIQIIGTVTKPLTVDDPTITFDLPNDIVSVKIQILITSGSFGAARYVTDNPSIWFDLGSPSIANPYVTVTKVGNAFVNQLKVNHTLFPSLAAINNGNFVMSFGIVRTSLNSQFENAKQDTELLQKELQAKITGNVKYLKTYSGTISCYFFGAVPLPGMSLTVNYCGKQVSGIIEGVSINGNGIMNLDVAQYFRINLLDRKLSLDLTNGNFSNR